LGLYFFRNYLDNSVAAVSVRPSAWAGDSLRVLLERTKALTRVVSQASWAGGSQKGHSRAMISPLTPIGLGFLGDRILHERHVEITQVRSILPPTDLGPEPVGVSERETEHDAEVIDLSGGGALGD
jgi:hypothetical protein